MESEQEQIVDNLMKVLGQYGFYGTSLRVDVSQQVELGVPLFKVVYYKRFGQDLMSYTLPFEWDPATSGYQLKQVHAVHRDPVEIEAKLIEGIDITILDKEMESINWSSWYGNGLDDDDRKSAGIILRKLTRLYHSADPEGKTTQQLLMYKHWPQSLFNLYRKTDGQHLEHAYEHEYVFRLEEWPQFSAELAYLVMSEQMDYLNNQVTGILQSLFPGIDPTYDLQQRLRSFPESDGISGTYNSPEGFAEYIIPFYRKEGKYQLENYKVSYTSYPEPAHGTFNGINSAELEAMMKEVDWGNDHELFIFPETKEPDFSPKVAMIDDQLYRLGQDLVGGNIADILWLKYMQEATFFEGAMPQSAWDLLNELPKVVQWFSLDINLRKAKNLLAGRAVQYPAGPEAGLTGRDWIRIDPNKRFSNDALLYSFVTGPNSQDIENMLRMLLVNNSADSGYWQMLLDGERITVKNDLGKTLRLEADPENNCLNVYNESGQQIPFNFQLNPGKHLAAQMRTQQENLPHQGRANRKNNPGMGI